MQQVFPDTKQFDKIARERFHLTEDIMIENAATALESQILLFVSDKQQLFFHVLIVTGSGNNGADGYALARRLFQFNNKIVCSILEVYKAKSNSCTIQKDRAEKAGVRFSNGIEKCDIIVDCLFGSGFHGEPDKTAVSVINQLNELNAFVISCDNPSCIQSGICSIKANITVAMGALNTALFIDNAKDYVGKIICANLGISRFLYESNSQFPYQNPETTTNKPHIFLLEPSDIQLPHRTTNNVNKGTFGHSVFISGEKPGAAVIAGKAASTYGSGLVTIVNSKTKIDGCPFDLMQSKDIPKNATSIALGMGLGRDENVSNIFDSIPQNIPCVLDADILYSSFIENFLAFKSLSISKLPIEQRETAFIQNAVVLTPHPKEFAILLENCGFGKFSLNETITNRFELSAAFCSKYPAAILVAKGANTVISYSSLFIDENDLNCEKSSQNIFQFINTLGKPCLAKGGSGDVLTGLICSLLAQGYKPYTAALQATLAHSLASCKIECDYSMSPFDLISNLKKL